MKIGITGNGKMAKAVEIQASRRSHTTYSMPYDHPAGSDHFSIVDCIIDFSHADVAKSIVSDCLEAGKPVVSGTTGWNSGLSETIKQCERLKGAFCWAPNFSVGMHIALHINDVLARIMNRFEDYSPNILEVHHISKKDAPSGTAIALAEQVVQSIDRIKKWELLENQVTLPEVLTIDSVRQEEIKGIHRVTYKSPEDTISIRHHALSRDGFAAGAVMAAEWLYDKTGFFTFEDVLNFQKKP